jgi:signal transduction histidine kinase
MKQLSVAACLWSKVVTTLEEARPEKVLPGTVFAVFRDNVDTGTFQGLATLHDITLHPDWIFADLSGHRQKVTVTSKTSVRRALSLMDKHQLEAVAVLEQRRFIGAVTRQSILEALLQREHELLHESRRLSKLLDKEHARTTEQMAKLSCLTRHQESVIEEEKTRIAQEIHDEFGGILTALKIDLRWLNKKLPQNLPDVQDKVYKMTAQLDQAIQAVRHIATQLRPSILDHLGLLAAIDWQFNEFQKLTGISGVLTLPDSDLTLDGKKSTAVFRILQAALTNITLHANATAITLTVAVDTHKLTLTLSDNGCGMTPAQMHQPGKFGIIGMYERAKNVNGRVTLESQLHKGTTLILTVPLLPSTEHDTRND